MACPSLPDGAPVWLWRVAVTDAHGRSYSDACADQRANTNAYANSNAVITVDAACHARRRCV